eukprot:8865933-Pyramimonas_sp.AAC.1
MNPGGTNSFATDSFQLGWMVPDDPEPSLVSATCETRCVETDYAFMYTLFAEQKVETVQFKVYQLVLKAAPVKAGSDQSPWPLQKKPFSDAVKVAPRPKGKGKGKVSSGKGSTDSAAAKLVRHLLK